MCLFPSVLPVFYNRISQQFINFKEDAFKIITQCLTKHRYWGQGVFLHTSQCRRPGQVSQLQADEEGEVPTAPRCPLIPQLACLNFAYVIPPEEYLGLHGLSLHWPFIHSALAVQGFQQAVVHSRSLKETWLFFLYQNQLSEMMSLGKRMENLLSTSPVLLLLSFGGRYLRHPLIWYSWFFLEPRCIGSTPHFFSSQCKCILMPA